jgi:hypothetical protein
MEEIIKEAFLSSIEHLREEVQNMPISLWTESVFRYGFCRSIAMTRKEVELFIECGRIDLVLSNGNQRAFVEFKFYVHPRRFDPYGNHKTNAFKGGPGLKNLAEFNACVKKLHDREPRPHVSKYVVLVYIDPTDGSRENKRYSAHYDDYSHPEQNIKICNILTSDPFETEKEIVKGRLYRIGT